MAWSEKQYDVAASQYPPAVQKADRAEQMLKLTSFLCRVLLWSLKGFSGGRVSARHTVRKRPNAGQAVRTAQDCFWKALMRDRMANPVVPETDAAEW